MDYHIINTLGQKSFIKCGLKGGTQYFEALILFSVKQSLTFWESKIYSFNFMRTNQIMTYYPEAVPILITADCVIFGYDREELKLLLFRRKVEPFKNELSVIGSFVRPEEDVDAAAVRVLEELTGLIDSSWKPLGCYGKVDRDPCARVITQAFFALIWLGGDDFGLIFSVRHRPIVFELLPEKFAIPQLQNLYEAIYQRDFDRSNFRKKILSMNVLNKLDEKDKSTSKKGLSCINLTNRGTGRWWKKGLILFYDD